MTFDVEPLIYEMAQRMCQNKQQEFRALQNFDVGILDVDVASMKLFCLTKMILLVNQSAADDCRGKSELLFQSSFKFNWCVRTGNFIVVQQGELERTYPSEIEKPDSEWKPVQDEIKAMRVSGSNQRPREGVKTLFLKFQGDFEPLRSLRQIEDDDAMVRVVLDNVPDPVLSGSDSEDEGSSSDDETLLL